MELRSISAPNLKLCVPANCAYFDSDAFIWFRVRSYWAAYPAPPEYTPVPPS